METAVMDCVMVDDYHCLLNTGFDLLFQSVKNGRCNKMKAHPALFWGVNNLFYLIQFFC